MSGEPLSQFITARPERNARATTTRRWTTTIPTIPSAQQQRPQLCRPTLQRRDFALRRWRRHVRTTPTSSRCTARRPCRSKWRAPTFTGTGPTPSRPASTPTDRGVRRSARFITRRSSGGQVRLCFWYSFWYLPTNLPTYWLVPNEQCDQIKIAKCL